MFNNRLRSVRFTPCAMLSQPAGDFPGPWEIVLRCGEFPARCAIALAARTFSRAPGDCPSAWEMIPAPAPTTHPRSNRAAAHLIRRSAIARRTGEATGTSLKSRRDGDRNRGPSETTAFIFPEAQRWLARKFRLVKEIVHEFRLKTCLIALLLRASALARASPPE